MNLSETAKGLFRSLAPVAASFFGTPLAGLAVKSVLDRWLGAEQGKPLDAKQVERALATLTPEQALALQRADQEFALQMEQLGLKAEELQVEAERVAGADRASARAGGGDGRLDPAGAGRAHRARLCPGPVVDISPCDRP